MHSHIETGATVLRVCIKHSRRVSKQLLKLLILMAYDYLSMYCVLDDVTTCAEMTYLINGISLLQISCLGKYHSSHCQSDSTTG